MAFSVNWGDVLKVAAPTVANMAAGKVYNRTETNNNAIQQARDAEDAAVHRARAEVEAGTLALAREKEMREAQNEAFRNSQVASLMKNMQDVNFNREGFRSKVPTVRFSGGLKPSAWGAEGQAAADAMNNNAMRTLMAPPSSSSYGPAVPRDGGVMPEYDAAEQEKAGFWENALGVAGLGAGIGGELLSKQIPKPGTTPKAAPTTPAAANTAGAGVKPAIASSATGIPVTAGGNLPGILSGIGGTSAGTTLGGVPITRGGNLAAALGGGGTSLSGVGSMALGGVPKFAAGGIPVTQGGNLASILGSGGGTGSAMMSQAPGAFSKGLGMANSIAGPLGAGLSIASGFLPAGKARTAADWAGKGAQIGSFIPGVGTAIGAGIGAGAGAVKGHQNATVKDRKDFAKKAGYRSLDDLYKALETMGPEGMRLREQGLNVIGKHDDKGNAKWMAGVEALLGGRR